MKFMKSKSFGFLALFAVIAAPAHAASGPFFSLSNSDFAVTLGFIAFILLLLYFKVPSKVASLLDGRAERIRAELEEARQLREEAQKLLADYEKKAREAEAQAQSIVADAKLEAEVASERAKSEIATSVQRRLAAAEAQITSAREDAERKLRDKAVDLAVNAARHVMLEENMKSSGPLQNNALEEAISRLQ